MNGRDFLLKRRFFAKTSMPGRLAGAFLLGCALLACAPMAPLQVAQTQIGQAIGGQAQAAQVSAVRVGGGAEATRVVIESDRQLDYRMFSLADQGLRIVLDLPQLDWNIPGEPASGGQRRAPGQGLVSQYRFAQNTADTSRLVLDLSGPAQVANAFVLSPGRESPNYRLVLDLTPTTYQAFASGSGFTPSPFAPAAPDSRIAQAAPELVPAVAVLEAPRDSAPVLPSARRTIVIDAGHGGRDPGAIGPAGKREKDINLAAALALRDTLQATGRYDVVLTRSTDIYLDLDRRVRIARENNADLFISLHADASENRQTRGASVYTLSDTGAVRARGMVLSSSNDWAMDVTNGRSGEVSGILVDLAQRDTKNQSAAFAEVLTGELGGVSQMLRNSHREAGYYVLLAPDVPAILLEMGFMSNPTDESNLSTSTYRQTLMSATARAIDNYFGARERRVAGN